MLKCVDDIWQDVKNALDQGTLAGVSHSKPYKRLAVRVRESQHGEVGVLAHDDHIAVLGRTPDIDILISILPQIIDVYRGVSGCGNGPRQCRG